MRSSVASSSRHECLHTLFKKRCLQVFSLYPMPPFAIRIEVLRSIKACRDAKDDKFLELAVNGGADAIITGGADLLILHPFLAYRFSARKHSSIRNSTEAKSIHPWPPARCDGLSPSLSLSARPARYSHPATPAGYVESRRGRSCRAGRYRATPRLEAIPDSPRGSAARSFPPWRSGCPRGRSRCLSRRRRACFQPGRSEPD